MSIKLMTMVFDRYPGAGNEMLLALAIADHAQDDGTRIWPALKTLAHKARMDVRTVRRNLRKMEATTWLQLVRKASGRPGDTNEYRISADWIAGRPLPETAGNLPPVDDDEDRVDTEDKLSPVDECSPVNNVIHTAGMDGQTAGMDGQAPDTAVSAESSRTINNQKTPLPPAQAGGCGHPESRKPAVPVLRTRAQRNWRETRSGVEWMAGELGLPAWDPGPYGTGASEPFAAYERRVAGEFSRLGGKACS